MIGDANIRTQFLDSSDSMDIASIIADWENNQLLMDDLE